MEALAQESEGPAVSAEAWDRQPHPWRRYGARFLDVQLFGGVVMTMVGVLVGALASDEVFLWFTDEARWKQLLIFTPLSWIVGSFFVAVLLAWKGATPGKWLFGLRVIPGDDAPLTFRRAIRREALLLVWGIGFALPLLFFFAGLSSYSRVDKGHGTRWDEEAVLVSEGRAVAGWQLVGVIVGTVLVVMSWGWNVIEKLAAAGL